MLASGEDGAADYLEVRGGGGGLSPAARSKTVSVRGDYARGEREGFIDGVDVSEEVM